MGVAGLEFGGNVWVTGADGGVAESIREGGGEAGGVCAGGINSARS
jgi:hypothetical protein